MLFDEVNALIPTNSAGDKHSVLTQVYPEVRVKTPGKYGPSDFVVEANCDNAGWNWRKFTHEDVFNDIQLKMTEFPSLMRNLFAYELADVVLNKAEPRTDIPDSEIVPGVRVKTLLQASQVLAVAEHRRYARFEERGGGRFLPARFAVGIIFGNWTADDASALQKSGSKGLLILENKFGQPPTLDELTYAI